jgi:hypothetical protein
MIHFSLLPSDALRILIRPEQSNKSSLDVEGVDLGVTTAEIVDFIRESRQVVAKA